MSKGKRNREKRIENFKRLKLTDYSNDILSIKYNNDGSANVSFDMEGIVKLYKEHDKDDDFLSEEIFRLLKAETFEEYLAFFAAQYVEVEHFDGFTKISALPDFVISRKDIVDFHTMYEKYSIGNCIA